jgi:hypothetical protein
VFGPAHHPLSPFNAVRLSQVCLHGPSLFPCILPVWLYLTNQASHQPERQTIGHLDALSTHMSPHGMVHSPPSTLPYWVNMQRCHKSQGQSQMAIECHRRVLTSQTRHAHHFHALLSCVPNKKKNLRKTLGSCLTYA